MLHTSFAYKPHETLRMCPINGHKAKGPGHNALITVNVNLRIIPFPLHQ